MTYEEFIARKRFVAESVGFDPELLGSHLFPFQADIVRWALKLGRAAVWADCGLGKSIIALEWAAAVCKKERGSVLILTPLAVASQFVSEGEKFGIQVTQCREVGDIRPGINVTNYERLDRFDPAAFVGVVADESSIVKDYTSKTRNALIETFSRTKYRLACTATPAPNDHMELGNHAEFLGVMSRTEMLAMFFTHDGGSTQDWRIKGHARSVFWKWVSSWAVAIRKPSDLGYEDGGFVLPPLNVHQRVVSAGADFTRNQGTLFAVEARGLSEQREARRASLVDRVSAAAEIVSAEPSESWLVLCDLNDESTALTNAIAGAVEITGSDSSDEKEKRITAFVRCETRIVVSKSSIVGLGLNLQHCARIMFVGLSHSFELWYQAIRRVYRFGQTRPVECHVITSDADGAVVANLTRKQAEAAEMMSEIVATMANFNRRKLRATGRDATPYEPKTKMLIPAWIGKEDAA